MAFIKFINYKEAIRIGKTCLLAIPIELAKEHGYSESNRKVELYLDVDDCILGLKFFEAGKSTWGHKVVKICIKNIFSRLKLSPPKPRTILKHERKENMLAIDLSVFKQ